MWHDSEEAYVLCLCHQWCSLCKSSSESIGHLFLHCLVTFNLWLCLFREFDISWVLSKDCSPFYRRDKLPGKGQGKDRKLRCFGAALFWLSYGWFGWKVIDLILITMLVVKVRSYGRKSEYGLHFGLRLRQNLEIFLLGLFDLIGKLPFFCFPG